jgi:hypothetical protein
MGFILSGYVNSQNYRIWSSENPHAFVETRLHPVKVGVWDCCLTKAFNWTDIFP